jgi:hypothetical protein
MDVEAVVVEHEVLNKFKDLDKSYLQQEFNVLAMKGVMSWSEHWKGTWLKNLCNKWQSCKRRMML